MWLATLIARHSPAEWRAHKKSIRYTEIMRGWTKKSLSFNLFGPILMLLIAGCGINPAAPSVDGEVPLTSPKDPKASLPQPSVAKTPNTQEAVEMDFASLESDQSANAFLIRGFSKPRDERALLYLAAAKRLIQSGHYEDADVILGLLADAPLGHWGSAQQMLLYAAVLVGTNKPKRALTILSSLARPLDDDTQRALQYHLTLRALFDDDQVGAALELVGSDGELAKDPILSSLLAQQVYTRLSRLSEAELTETAETFALSESEIAWFTLTYILGHEGLQEAQLQQALGVWIDAHPSHPGRILATQRSRDSCVLSLEDDVALILPIDSPFEAAANAFKNGFLSRYPSFSGPATVSVFDFGNKPSDAVEHYARATAQGARVIVGPLGREGVDALAAKDSLPVPTLLIGLDSNAPRRNAFWFDISREAEAVDMVRHARSRNLANGLFIASSDAAARNLAQHAASTWSALGGDIVDSITISSNSVDYSELLIRVLGLEENEKRTSEFKALLGKNFPVQTEITVREDLDSIFVFAEPQTIRLLKPQLSFHKAGTVPVFTQSLIFDGSSDPVNDLDLEGISFPDMPWMTRRGSEFPRRAIVDTFGSTYTETALGRFFALGADAHAVACRLLKKSDRKDWSFDGLTGRLGIASNHRIDRAPDWVSFHDGSLRPFDPPIPREKARE